MSKNIAKEIENWARDVQSLIEDLQFCKNCQLLVIPEEGKCPECGEEIMGIQEG